MEAIILAGGFGTRLKSVVKDIPKPMAPIKETPFLQLLVDFLIDQGFERIIFAVSYKAEIIREHFGDEYRARPIAYSYEKSPLGTGGGLRQAFELVQNPEVPVLILNGDTFFNIRLDQFSAFHETHGTALSICVKELFDFDRYGTLSIANHQVQSFHEKKACQQGYINGGVYLANREFIEELPKTESFSLETAFEKLIDKGLSIGAYESKGYFIDIGIPVDYERAQTELTHLLK
jgi:D-glycero-alpha-D-manno-heptose 1-phosphate guanylyltransferase